MQGAWWPCCSRPSWQTWCCLWETGPGPSGFWGGPKCPSLPPHPPPSCTPVPHGAAPAQVRAVDSLLLHGQQARETASRQAWRGASKATKLGRQLHSARLLQQQQSLTDFAGVPAEQGTMGTSARS